MQNQPFCTATSKKVGAQVQNWAFCTAGHRKEMPDQVGHDGKEAAGMTGRERRRRAGEAPEWPSAIFSGLRVLYLPPAQKEYQD